MTDQRVKQAEEYSKRSKRKQKNPVAKQQYMVAPAESRRRISDGPKNDGLYDQWTLQRHNDVGLVIIIIL